MQLSDISFSELKKKKIIDSDGIPIGHIIDLNFDGDGRIWFVIGGGFVEETLERLNIRPDIDLLLPVDWMEVIEEDRILLNRTSFQLGSTCEECWLREKEELVRVATDQEHERNATLRLTEYRLI